MATIARLDRPFVFQSTEVPRCAPLPKWANELV